MATPCEESLLPIEGILDQLQEAVLVTDSQLDPPGPSIIYVNPAWERLTGYSAAEVVGRSPRLLQGEKSAIEALRAMRRTLQAKGSATVETVNYRRDGTPFHMAISISAITLQGNDATCYLALERDSSTHHEESERRRQLEGLTRIQREAATGSLNINRVRQRIAEAAMETTGADGAVVEEVEGTEMVYRATAGIAADSMGLRLPVDASASGLVYKSREPIHIRDIATDDRINREAAHKVGFQSGIIVPLIHENRTYGVLKVYANEPDRFADDDLHLLELASGVLAANLRKASEYASEERRRAMLLDALPALVAYVDNTLCYQEVNAAYEAFYGLDADSVRGRPLPEVLHPRNYERLHPYLNAVLAGNSVNFEATLISGQGEERMMRGSYEPHFDSRGDVVGFYKIIQDITEQNAAHTDYLTCLNNRREFERLGTQLLATAQRYEQPLGLIMLDLDHFKVINDTLGHLKGDVVLRTTAHLMSRNSRDADVVGRWGGEEFVVLLPETDAEGAMEMAERIRRDIAEYDFGVSRQVTASLGVTMATPEDDLVSLQNRADQALYSAKDSGRDKVVHK